MESEGKGLEHERKRIESQKQERIKNKNDFPKSSALTISPLIFLDRVFSRISLAQIAHGGAIPSMGPRPLIWDLDNDGGGA